MRPAEDPARDASTGGAATLGPAALVAVALLGCARTPAAPQDLPARPALGAPIDRVGRALTANALIGLRAPDAAAEGRKEAYNRARPADGAAFVADLAEGLALYDGFDGVCGNQWRVDRAPGYLGLARLLADDRLWIDARQTTCTQYLALERGVAGDCGGRTPAEDACDVFRSLLVLGAPAGIDDGVATDDHAPTARFPFLAAP
jgi:hypothetical protein